MEYTLQTLRNNTIFNTRQDALDFLDSFQYHMNGQPICVRYYNGQQIESLFAVGLKDYNDGGVGHGEDYYHIIEGNTIQQVNADWDATSGVAEILNKPNIPTVNDATITIRQNGTVVGSFTTNDAHAHDIDIDTTQVQADWDEIDTSSPAFIQHKPAIPIVHDREISIYQNNTLMGSFTLNQDYDMDIELTGGETEQVQSNWTEANINSPAFIRNKPNLADVATTGSYNDLTDTPDIQQDFIVEFTVTENNNDYTVTTDTTPTQLRTLLQAGKNVIAVMALNNETMQTKMFSIINSDIIEIVFHTMGLGYAVFAIIGDVNGDTWTCGYDTLKISQDPKTDPVVNGESNVCIDSITQNTNGVITATKKYIDTYDALHDPRYNWRTPSKDEWDYLLNTRSASTLYDDYTQTNVTNARYIKAQVNSINGLIIVPDTFSYPATLDLGGLSHFQNINTANTPFTRNTCNLTNWVLLENTGCIFLPAAGTRTAASFTAGRAYYHSSSIKNENQKYYLFFRDNNLNATDVHYLYMGHSVRCISNNSVGAFSVSATTKCDFARGNLQYHCKQNKWRFARNQYEYIGADNANISQNFDGWIDLFGWGTSGWKSQAVCYQPWSTSTNNSDYLPDGTGTHDLTGNYTNADWGVWASHPSREWFGTQAEFEALTSYDNYEKFYIEIA